MSNLINQQKDSAETLSKMIDLLGLSAEQECNFDDRCIVLNLRSEDPGRLIGRNGQTIDALQTLINKMLRRHEDGFPRIVIDVDGYKKTRRTRRNKKDTDQTEAQNQDSTETNERPKRERPKRRERQDNPEENRKPKAKPERQNEQKVERQPRKPEREPRQERKPEREPRQERKPEREPRQERKPDRNNSRKPERQNGPRTTRREDDNRPEGNRSKLSDDRTEAIKKQAIEASKEAKRWGEKVTLPPMSSSERRLIHLTLQDDPAIVTESGADMPNGKKRVIVRSK